MAYDLRWLVRRLVVVFVILVILGVAGLAALRAFSEYTPITASVVNRSPTNLTLSVKLSNGPVVWQGMLKPGQSDGGWARIGGDSHLTIRCQAPGGPERVREWGYFTNGLAAAVDIEVRSCEDMTTEVQWLDG